MRSPRVGPWGPNVRGGGAVASESPGVVVEPGLCGIMGWVPPWWWPRSSGVRPHSLWWAAQGREMCGGEGTAMWGEPRVAAECTCTEREFGRCSRPTVRPGRNVNDDRDHGDGNRSPTSPAPSRSCAWPRSLGSFAAPRGICAHRRPVRHEERADLLRSRRAGHRRESIGLRIRVARVPREGVGVGDERRGGVGTERSLPPSDGCEDRH